MPGVFTLLTSKNHENEVNKAKNVVFFRDLFLGRLRGSLLEPFWEPLGALGDALDPPWALRGAFGEAWGGPWDA